MPLVAAKCTNCGGNLEVDNAKEAAICPYCGTPYIVEKAINNYNVTNHISVNVFASPNNDFVIRAGVLVSYRGAAIDVKIPDNVLVIGHDVFKGCSTLRSVTIPDGVTSIGYCAFERCSSLLSINIPNSVVKIGFAAFRSCTSLRNVSISNSIKQIEESTFDNCQSLKEILIPESVEEIGVWAFFRCLSLTSITIPSNVVYLDAAAFSKDCVALKEVIILGNPSFEHSRFYSGTLPEGCIIRASEEWKKANYFRFPEQLSAYAPPSSPPPPPAPNKKKNGCYIATAVYGSYDCPEVWTLRRFRDNYLAQSVCGRAFIRCYYAISPTLVRWFGKAAWFNRVWRNRLNRLIEHLHKKGYEDTPYNDK